MGHLDICLHVNTHSRVTQGVTENLKIFEMYSVFLEKLI